MKSKANDNSGTITPEGLVDICIEQLCMFNVSEVTRKGIVDYTKEWGPLNFTNSVETANAEKNIVATLQLIVTSMEYQFA